MTEPKKAYAAIGLDNADPIRYDGSVVSGGEYHCVYVPTASGGRLAVCYHGDDGERFTVHAQTANGVGLWTAQFDGGTPAHLVAQFVASAREV